MYHNKTGGNKMSENMIKDSGQTREFDTGSHRDMAIGKGRCDLLPECAVLKVLDCTSKAQGHTVQEHLKEAVRNVMQFKIDITKQDYLVQAAYEALVAVGLSEGDTLENVDLTSTLSCMSIGLLKTSIHYEVGANKYGENNWKLGQPMHVLIDSGLRHTFKGISGNDDEPHIRAAAWNYLCAIWTMDNIPTLMDLPTSGNNKPKKK